MDRFNLLWVRFDTAGAEGVAIETDLGLGELTFGLIEAEVVVLKSLSNTTKVSVMFILSIFQIL